MKTKYTDEQMENIARHTYQGLVQTMRDFDMPIIETGYHKKFVGYETGGGFYYLTANIFVPDFESHEQAIRLASLPEYYSHVNQIIGISPKRNTSRYPCVRDNVNLIFVLSQHMNYKSSIKKMKEVNPESVLFEMTIQHTHENLPIDFNLFLTGKEYAISQSLKGDRPLYRSQSKIEKLIRQKFGWND